MEDSILNFLNYEGLEYYDGKSEERTDKKIAVETKRAKTVESTLTTNLNNEISRAKKAEENNATSIDNEVTRATNAENTLATNLSSHTSNKSNPHGVTKAQVGLGNVNNTSDANKPISTATQTALNAKAPLASPTLTGTPKAPTATAGTNTTQIATTAFVQREIGNLINGAPETANTLKELSDLIEEHQDVTDALNAAIGNKVDKVDGKGLSTNDYTTTEKTKLSGIATGAEVNQNAFSNVVVGSTTIAADSKTDTLTLTAGSNVTITPDATNDKITISSSHPTISKSTNTTSTASPSAGGTFTAIDSITQDSNGHVTKFNTKTVTLPSTPVTIDSALSATSTNPVQNNVVTQALNGKQSTITGAISTLVSDNLNPNYVPVSNSEGKVVSSDIKTTELNYLSGVSSNIQTQLNNKQNNLGFTPIQQGGGSGQSTNKIYIGWSGTELKAQVDTTDMGALAFKSHLNDYLPKSGGTMSGVIYGNNGGQFAPDGNVWLKQGGYDNWLSNILNGKINTEPEVYEVPTVLDGISFTYYKFGRMVWVQGGGIFTPVKTPYDGGSITIMNLADMPNVPRPIARARFYAHAIAASAFFDCVVTFNFNTDGYIVYECSADNIYAEYYIQGMFVTN